MSSCEVCGRKGGKCVPSLIKPECKAAIDSRYPYTYACDFVRRHCVDFSDSAQMHLPTLSRSQASQVMAAFEKAFGLSHEEMAKRLADEFLKEQET